MGVGFQRHAPAALPPGKTEYLLYRRLGGIQGRSGRVWKKSNPPGFDPRTVQPAASRYTDLAIPAHPPKHVGVGTYHELFFMIRILLYFTMCTWFMFWI